MFLTIGIIFFVLLAFQLWYIPLKLRRMRRRYHTLLENAGDAVVIINKKGKLVHASTSIFKVLGYTVKQSLNLDILSIAHPDDVAQLQVVMAEVMANPGVPVKGHTGRMRHGDGTWHWYEAIVTNMLHDPDICGIVDNFRDVTASMQAEEKMNSANRLYLFISQINQAIAQKDSERGLFKETCKIAIEYGKYQMAWVGIFNAKKSMVTLSESMGIGTQYLENFNNVKMEIDGPMFKVLQTGKSFVCNDIAEFHFPAWRNFADANKLKSFMVLPIRKNGELIGVLSLYATQCNFFDEQERRLLEEIAIDISFAMDIFEKEHLREMAEKKHRHSELRLKQAQSIAQVGSFEIDFSTGISTWSEELCRIYGFDIADNKHPYNDWLKMVHPDDIQNVMKVIDEVKISLANSAIYHRIIRLDGTIRNIFSRGEYDLDSNGNPVGMHGVAHDITEIKKLEGARNQSEQNLQLIMDLIPQRIFIKDIQGKYLFVNKSFAMGYGVSPEEFLSDLRYQTMEVGEEQEQVLEQDRQVIKTGVSLTIPEFLFTASGGSLKYFYTVKVPYTLAGASERSMLGIALDITDQKNAELERTKMIADLTQRNKDLEQFSYVVSHNVRAPLVNIISLISLLDPKTTGTNGKDILSALTISTNKLDAVIKDLNFILNMNHEINEAKQEVSFDELIGDIKISVANLLMANDVVLSCDFSQVDGIFTYKSYLHSIFYNLILNSIKYSRPGVTSIIQVSSRLSEGKLVLEFSDNGLGIDLERYQEQLFGLYKRFHPEIEGKGMGLYMVKMHVEQLKGSISVKSELNVGTSFTIEFESDLPIV